MDNVVVWMVSLNNGWVSVPNLRRVINKLGGRVGLLSFEEVARENYMAVAHGLPRRERLRLLHSWVRRRRNLRRIVRRVTEEVPIAGQVSWSRVVTSAQFRSQYAATLELYRRNPQFQQDVLNLTEGPLRSLIAELHRPEVVDCVTAEHQKRAARFFLKEIACVAALPGVMGKPVQVCYNRPIAILSDYLDGRYGNTAVVGVEVVVVS